MPDLETSILNGYGVVWKFIKQYFYGWWLQVSRSLAIIAWFVVAALAAGALGVAHSALGLIGGIIVFLGIPVVLGYYEVGINNSQKNQDYNAEGSHSNPYASDDEDYVK